MKMKQNKEYCLAKAVILFFTASFWGKEEQEKWEELTGYQIATYKNLVNLAEEVCKKYE